MTETELRLIAAPAIMGASQKDAEERKQDFRRKRDVQGVVDECKEEVRPYIPHRLPTQMNSSGDRPEVVFDEGDPALTIATSVPVPLAMPTSASAELAHH